MNKENGGHGHEAWQDELAMHKGRCRLFKYEVREHRLKQLRRVQAITLVRNKQGQEVRVPGTRGELAFQNKMGSARQHE